MRLDNWPWLVLRQTNYERATSIWYWWHRHVCQPMYWRNYPTYSRNYKVGYKGARYYYGPAIKFRNGSKGGWLYRLQLKYICGPLDDWSHNQPEVVVKGR